MTHALLRHGADRLAIDRDEERESRSSLPLAVFVGQPAGEPSVTPSSSAHEHRACFRCGAPAIGMWRCPTGRVELACADHADHDGACCGGRCRWCDEWRSDGGGDPMTCPSCKSDTRVTETRTTALGLRRRRICLRVECGARFTTYEVPAPGVIVDDGARLVIVDGSTAAALRLAAHEIDKLLPDGAP